MGLGLEALDFVINGQPYLGMLDRARGLGSDLIGCFVVGFADENQRAAARLLMEEAPDSPSGRVIVYACAECGDIGCRTLRSRRSRRPVYRVTKRLTLSKRMSLRAFENGYWYATELIAFGKELGLPAAHRMRKNELEDAITAFLRTGRLPKKVASKPLKKGVKDLDLGLTLDLPIGNYTSVKATKDFIRREARRKNPDVRQKSGVWYRLNRWREAQVVQRTVTYGELVDQYVALNRLERFARIPHPRYINFLSDFLAAEKGASHAQARAAWKKLKSMDAPKTYDGWKKAFPRPEARGPKPKIVKSFDSSAPSAG